MMITPLTPNDVQKILDDFGLDIAVQSFTSSTRTAQDAADSIGTALGSIVKSLVFDINKAQLIVILMSGNGKVDTKKVAQHFGVGRKKVKIATAEQCIEFIGYAPGGVPPIGHRTTVPIFMDQSLARFETIYAAAGTANTIFPIAYKTLLNITKATIKDFALT